MGKNITVAQVGFCMERTHPFIKYKIYIMHTETYLISLSTYKVSAGLKPQNQLRAYASSSGISSVPSTLKVMVQPDGK